MLKKMIHMNVVEEYIILLDIRLQFKNPNVLYSYKSHKLERFKREYMTQIWYAVNSKMRFI